MYVLKKSIVLFSQTWWSGFQPMQSARIYSAEPSLAKPDGPVSKHKGSKISRRLNDLGEMTTAKPDD
jgi:hypothetical protein